MRAAHLVFVLGLSVALAGPAFADSALPVPAQSITSPTRPSPAVSATFKKRVALHKQSQVARSTELARRLFMKQQYAQAARHCAIAYAFAPDAELLFSLAQMLRKAELDTEALGVYQRLLQEQPQTPHLAFVNEELAILRVKLEDPESDVLQMTRDHIDAAKQSFQKGSYLVSAEEFALAYAIKRLPRMLFNIAQAYRRAGHPEDAYLVFDRFSEEEPQTPLIKEVVGYQSELAAISFKPPLSKRPWFWGVVGAGAAVLIAGSAGLGVALRSNDPQTVLGTHSISFGLSYIH